MQGQGTLDGMRETRAVMQNKRIAVAAEDKRHVEYLSVSQGLLHATPNGVVVILSLDHSDGQVGLVEEQIVSALTLTAHRKLATHDDAASRKTELATDLRGHVPASRHDGRSDILVTDVRLRERLGVHGVFSLCDCGRLRRRIGPIKTHASTKPFLRQQTRPGSRSVS